MVGGADAGAGERAGEGAGAAAGSGAGKAAEAAVVVGQEAVKSSFLVDPLFLNALAFKSTSPYPAQTALLHRFGRTLTICAFVFLFVCCKSR